MTSKENNVPQVSISMLQSMISSDCNGSINFYHYDKNNIGGFFLRIRAINTTVGSQLVVKEVGMHGEEGSGSYFALDDLESLLRYSNELAERKASNFIALYRRLGKDSPSFHVSYRPDF